MKTIYKKNPFSLLIRILSRFIVASQCFTDASQMPGLIPGSVRCQTFLDRTQVNTTIVPSSTMLECIAFQAHDKAHQTISHVSMLLFLLKWNNSLHCRRFRSVHPERTLPIRRGLGCPLPRICRKHPAQGLQSKHIKSVGNL